jgi:threonine-phosphate decarboxylase
LLLEEFTHGGGVEKFASDIGCTINEVIELSSNINFIKPNINLDFNTLDISAYPTYDKLYDVIAKNYNINSSQLELFNGGSSAIFTLFRYLNLKTCTIYSPAYLEYKKASKKMGYKLNLINRFENINEKVEKDSLVIFVNPSTPDGKFYDIEKLLSYWNEQNCTVLIDESFLDFTNKESVIRYLNIYPKLYILKSMTKFYSSAGIRIGCIVSNTNNIQNLNINEPMWKLSQFDSNYLQEALKDNKFKEKSKLLNTANRKILKKVLEDSGIFEKVFETHANYFLLQLKDIKACKFQDILKHNKIMIRDCSNFDFLDNSYVRIAVKDMYSIRILQKTLKGICSE